MNMVGIVGGFLGPYVIGAVKSGTGSFRGGFLAASAVLAIGGAIVPLLRLSRKRRA